MKTGTTYDRLYRAAHALGNSSSALVDGRHDEFVGELDTALGLLAEVVRGSDKLTPAERVRLSLTILDYLGEGFQNGVPEHSHPRRLNDCDEICAANGCSHGYS